MMIREQASKKKIIKRVTFGLVIFIFCFLIFRIFCLWVALDDYSNWEGGSTKEVHTFLINNRSFVIRNDLDIGGGIYLVEDNNKTLVIDKFDAFIKLIF